jgi:hypothetical protein
MAEDYPPAYPRTGVTQVLENNRVFVWEVHWLNGVKQPIHRHRYDMAGVYLRYGPIVVTTPDGKARPSEPFDVPRPYYQPRDITHKEEGSGGPNDPERLAIMVDLREPNPTGAASSSKMDPAFPREGAKDVIDNQRVREWDYTWIPGKDPNKHEPMRVYARDSVHGGREGNHEDSGDEGYILHSAGHSAVRGSDQRRTAGHYDRAEVRS